MNIALLPIILFFLILFSCQYVFEKDSKKTVTGLALNGKITKELIC